jgi:hypothetical protein
MKNERAIRIEGAGGGIRIVSGRFELSRRQVRDSRNEFYSVKAVRFEVQAGTPVSRGDTVKVSVDGESYSYRVSAIAEGIGKTIFYCDM